MSHTSLAARGTDIGHDGSGSIFALARAYESTHAEPFKTLLTRAAAQLECSLSTALKRNSLRPGFAHGLSGVATVFTVVDRVHDRVDYQETVALCLALEDRLMKEGHVDARARSQSWCWGATGQLTARLGSTAIHPSELGPLREQTRSLDLWDRSLCHGSIGQTLLLRTPEYCRVFGETDGVEASKQLSLALIEDPSPVLGKPDYAFDPGLFGGASGALLFLSAVRDGMTFRPHTGEIIPAWTP